MRNFNFAIIFCGLLFFSQLTWAQQPDEPQILVDKNVVSFEKISGNNYKLTLQWSPFPGAYRYRIRYSDQISEIKDPEDLSTSRLTNGDSTTITLQLTSNMCFMQVSALDESSGAIAQSGVYRITLSFDEAKVSSGLDSGFITAFNESFKEMDPLAGWGIVLLIGILFIYGSYITISLNREVKVQNPVDNKELAKKVDEFMEEWKQNLEDKDNLARLYEKVQAYNNNRYGILGMIEKGLRNHIDNFGRSNVSQEVDRDMEKAIFYELENLKLGNYSTRAKHISLIRIKMFGETAPMLGLLGTVSGLIVAFFDILQTSQRGSDYQQLLSELSSGIYSAIVTTIIGLIVGIILLFFHHGVESNIKRLQNAWNQKYIDISKTIS